ncbi:MAG: hypothetical protein ACKO4Z_11470 [Planctomycetota bacterium]|nr:hypothetical protein [Planctomycetota bacterium]
MRAVVRCLPVVALSMVVAGSGCKSLNERYIALEVWKYEKCFGHLPPGFTPPGAAPVAAAAPRVCGQQQQCCESAPVSSGCNSCEGGTPVIEGSLPGGLPAGVSTPVGPGGSPGPAAAMPTPAGVTAGKPIVISDEVVIP